MAINTVYNFYNDDDNTVTVYVNGKPVGCCEESQLDALLEKLSIK